MTAKRPCKCGCGTTDRGTKISHAQQGQPHKSSGPCSPETKARISQALRGRVISDEWRDKIRAANLGTKRPCPPECTCGRHTANSGTWQPGNVPWNLGMSAEEIFSLDGLARAREGGRKKLTGRKLSDAHRRKLSESAQRRWRSAEGRQILSDRAARRIAAGVFGGATQWQGAFTKPELRMAALLEEAGVSYEPQVRFGRYVADFWLPATNEVIEVDGVYWHPEGPDEERDQYLLSNGVSRVSHITDMQLKAASSLEEVMPYVRGI